MTSQAILKGAIDGLKENQYLLAEKYYYGMGAEKNVALAESWYKEAAKRGHTASIYMYAYLLLSGEGGNIDLKKGTRYLKKAVKRNYLHALLLLARNYYYGYGVKKSEKFAFKLWDKGAKLGCPEAEYYLGLCYAKGIHVKTNILKSKKHLYNALENGYQIASIAIEDFINPKLI
ncbi:MAG: sel1 repeat family protein [Clostridiales bacterium]|nr:sel1 repeat family protein [Clostridiales bacterium]